MSFPKELFEKHSIVDWGFSHSSKAETYPYFEKWIEDRSHGPLSYLADYRKEKREDLKNYFPEFETSISFLFSYASTKKALTQLEGDKSWNGKKISSYALGFFGYDYHHVIKEALAEIGEYLKSRDPTLKLALSLDVHPVLERDLAVKSGLGFFGKNSMLINRKEGSFHIIGSLLLSKKMNFEKIPQRDVDHCGNCVRCIDLCPTDAINQASRTIISDRCISTFTIELFKEDAVSPPGMENGGGEIFGCDICQDVCPWNVKLLKKIETKQLSQKAEEHLEFFLKRPLGKVIDEVNPMTNRGYAKKFKGTSFERLGRKGMLKNLLFWQKANPS